MSEHCFRAIVEQSHDAYVVLAPDGSICYASPSIVRIGGRRPAEVVGENFSHWCRPDDLAELARKFSDFQQRPGESMVAQYRFQHQDGSWRWVAATCTNMLAEPSVGGIICHLRDVTEERQAADARAQLAAIVVSSDDAIISTDLEGTIQTWNVGAERLLGYTADEIVGQPVYRLAPPEYYAQVRDCLRRGGRGQQIPTYEVQRLRKDGAPVTVAVTLSPLKGPGGEIRGMCATYRDVTAQREAESRLREWRDRYEAAIRATGQILYDWNSATNAVAWGGSYEQTLGYALEEMPRGFDDAILSLVHPEDRDELQRHVRRAIDTGDPVDTQCRIRRVDGTYIVGHSRGHFFRDQQGGALRMVGFVQDVTEQVRLEDQLRQSQKMEAIGRLAGGVAHDFNNLLMIIGYNSETLLEELDEDDEARVLVAEIKEAGNRAAGLTGQLLAFSRKQMVQREAVDLNAVVAELQKMLGRIIGEDVKLATQLDAAIRSISADPTQLQQIILNLAVNARDAMPQGGLLTLRTDNVDSSGGYADDHAPVQPGPYVRLSVSDTGCGMTDATRVRIFEPFFTTKEQGKGTGLGLSTVYGIVKQFGGHIRVRSEVEHGTTFEILFPALDAESIPEDGAAPKSALPRGSETVLMVEDEDSVRSVTRRMIGQLGYRVLVAESGFRALDVADEHSGTIDLLVTDVVMPGMGGRQLAESLRARRPRVKVLYLSGYTNDAVIHHGISSSEVAFLQKPFTMAALAQRLRDVLDGRV